MKSKLQSATHIDTLTATITHLVSVACTVTGTASVTETLIASVIVIVGVSDTVSDLLTVVLIDAVTLIYYCYSCSTAAVILNALWRSRLLLLQVLLLILLLFSLFSRCCCYWFGIGHTCGGRSEQTCERIRPGNT